MASDWRQRQKQELRQQLYQNALELFETHGYDSTTVQQITEAVGVAKGTFFNHFPTKEHLVGEWYHSITVESLEAAHQRGSTSAEAAVCDLFVDMVERAIASPELMVAKSQNSSDPLLIEAEQTQADAIDVFVRQQCTAGKDQGELAADLDEDFFASLLTAVLTGSSRAWVRSQPRFDFPGLIRQRIQFLFRAAKPARG